MLEVELGIARLGRRDVEQAQRLCTWLEDDLLAVFDGRILSMTVHGLTVITRNVADFEPMGVALINPWSHVGGGLPAWALRQGIATLPGSAGYFFFDSRCQSVS